jgi:hypothetical protein
MSGLEKLCKRQKDMQLMEVSRNIKMRLVVRGFSQAEGVNYDETY